MTTVKITLHCILNLQQCETHLKYSFLTFSRNYKKSSFSDKEKNFSSNQKKLFRFAKFCFVQVWG